MSDTLLPSGPMYQVLNTSLNKLCGGAFLRL
jgi:hypothetical protein